MSTLPLCISKNTHHTPHTYRRTHTYIYLTNWSKKWGLSETKLYKEITCFSSLAVHLFNWTVRLLCVKIDRRAHYTHTRAYMHAHTYIQLYIYIYIYIYISAWIAFSFSLYAHTHTNTHTHTHTHIYIYIYSSSFMCVFFQFAFYSIIHSISLPSKIFHVFYFLSPFLYKWLDLIGIA